LSDKQRSFRGDYPDGTPFIERGGFGMAGYQISTGLIFQVTNGPTYRIVINMYIMNIHKNGYLNAVRFQELFLIYTFDGYHFPVGRSHNAGFLYERTAAWYPEETEQEDQYKQGKDRCHVIELIREGEGYDDVQHNQCHNGQGNDEPSFTMDFYHGQLFIR
jgi:hypothetical protein